MPAPWEQQPKEPSDAYEAFSACLDRGSKRKILDAYRELSGSPEARQVSGTWNRWKKKWKWEERWDAHDRHQLEETNRARKAALQEQFNRELEQYRKAHEQVGKSGFNTVLRLMQGLEEFAISYTGDPRKGVDPETGKLRVGPTRKIQTPSEAKLVSSVIKEFMGFAPAVWEAALGIPELREQLEANQE